MTAVETGTGGARLRRRAGTWLFDAPSWTWLAPLVARRRGRLALLFALGVAAAAAALVPPYLTKLVIDEGLVARDPGALILWTAALFGFGLAALGLGALNSILHMRASVAMLAELRAALVEAALTRTPAWRAERRAGDLLSRIDGDAGEVQRFAVDALLGGAGAMLRLLGGAAMLFVLEWRLALVALALTPLELLFFHHARPKTERLARETRAARGGFAGRTAEMLHGLTALQAVRGERAVAAALTRSQATLTDALIRAQLWGEVTRGAPMILAAIARAAVFLAGGLMVIRGDWPLGSLIAFLAYLGFLTGPAHSLLGLWHAQARMRAALDRLNDVMTAEPRPRWPARPAPLPPGGGALRLDSVAVAAGGRTLLRGVDLAIGAGEKIRLDGPSGAGKSSLLALLQRHADPAAGRIRLDGADIATLSRDDLRGAVALVPQADIVLKGSVAENLALAAPQADAAAMRAVLALVELHERLAPETPVGEGGLTLSGGERRRLGLARALLSPFHVLALDEALAEVDPARIARIMAALDARFPDRTRIVVAHGAAEAHGPFDRVVDVTPWRVAS